MTDFSPNENFYYYLYWISERMQIFWNRKEGMQGKLTEDEILSTFKFTNVYRSLDRVSQYLIKNVLYNEKGLANDYDTEDIFWRTILFKHFNKIETWEALEQEFGDITLDIKFKDLADFLDTIDGTIYSNAYMLTASFMRNPKYHEKYGFDNESRKHRAYLQIFKRDLFENKLFYQLLRAKSLEELYKGFSQIPTVGKFLAYQYSIDLNYSILYNFSENDFVVAGPGAERGILRTFDIEGKPDYIEIIKWVHANFDELMKSVDLSFTSLPNRNPTLIDIQNCFCETDKYLRGLGVGNDDGAVSGKRIKNYFTPTNKKIDFYFPPKWGVNL